MRGGEGVDARIKRGCGEEYNRHDEEYNRRYEPRWSAASVGHASILRVLHPVRRFLMRTTWMTSIASTTAIASTMGPPSDAAGIATASGSSISALTIRGRSRKLAN